MIIVTFGDATRQLQLFHDSVAQIRNSWVKYCPNSAQFSLHGKTGIRLAIAMSQMGGWTVKCGKW